VVERLVSLSDAVGVDAGENGVEEVAALAGALGFRTLKFDELPIRSICHFSFGM
jgi:hypothetical protein